MTEAEIALRLIILLFPLSKSHSICIPEHISALGKRLANLESSAGLNWIDSSAYFLSHQQGTDREKLCALSDAGISTKKAQWSKIGKKRNTAKGVRLAIRI